ncbi:amidinotransferase [Candidatus Roizmanbacteria bacterium]|nr:amidinotransferase [Candidatus Roizmanbacteria bacterium]
MKARILKKVLACEPRHFQVSYQINPWMQPGTVDQALAGKQWRNLINALRQLQVEVVSIHQRRDLPDMVFAADAGWVNGESVYLGNFRFVERSDEQRSYAGWFEKNNYTLVRLPENCFFEGGDVVECAGNVFVGTGLRSDRHAVGFLSKKLKRIYELRLIDKNFFHLDTCLFALNDETAFYYPEALAKESIQVLRKLIPHLYILTKPEAYGFAANSVVTDHHVLIPKGNQIFADRLRKLDYRPIELDVSEFIKAGGGIHCLLQILKTKHQ